MGIRHVVLFKFKNGVTWSDPRAVAAERATREHPRHIPEIQRWQCGRNVAQRAIAHDFALIGDFADQGAVARYLVHPDHMRGVELWRAIADWSVVDLEVAPDLEVKPFRRAAPDLEVEPDGDEVKPGSEVEPDPAE